MFSQPIELLWPGGAPSAVGNSEADKPSLTVRLADPAKANGTAVVVLPGGSYGHLAFDHEGLEVANWLNAHGISAFVLKYRHAPAYRHPIPLQDAQRAIRMVRSRAQEWKINPTRVGIWGFSAGGHLASTTGTRFDDGNPSAPDPIDRVGSRPDFMVLAYPVISLTTEYVHKNSRANLLGPDFSQELARELSNDTQVTARTPPTFLFHTDQDSGVPPENSVLFYLALRKAKVPAELHIYRPGVHGVGLAQKDPALATWPGHVADWLKGLGMIP